MKNGLTEQEMDEAGKRWSSHKGPYMTLAETLLYAAEKAKTRTENQDIKSNLPEPANPE